MDNGNFDPSIESWQAHLREWRIVDYDGVGGHVSGTRSFPSKRLLLPSARQVCLPGLLGRIMNYLAYRLMMQKIVKS